jgi:hypothetical protein
MPKSTLNLLSPGANGIAPPRSLDDHGMALWERVQAEYGIVDTGGIEILAQICAALDRAESLCEAIDRDGEVVIIKGVPKAHPALRDELAARAFVVRGLERLGLNVEAVKPQGRPTRPRGWTGS